VEIMPLSISDSDRPYSNLRPDRFTIVLLGTIFVAMVLLEVVCREKFDNSSKVQRSELAERRELLTVRDAEASTDPHIALLGNSLMLHGIDIPLLRSNLNSRYVPVPYFVLGTNYFDWFFGLKRLFAEGMRPQYVLLGLSPNQLATYDVQGSMSARYLIQQSDLLDVVKQTHMDATTASEFVLAHYSEYYSTREITRGYVMSKVLPGVAELFHTQAASFRDAEIDESTLKPLAAARLAALDQLCRANGAHFLLVVPPSYQKGGDAILHAGMELGVKVLLPVRDDEFDLSDFEEDGIHLNEKGAQVFTMKLSVDLNKQLQK
jgi:hypothetical protein